MTDTNVNDIHVISDKQSLQYVDIRNAQITSIEPLSALDKLEFLLLNKDQVVDWELLEGKEGLEISEDIIIAK